MLFSVCIALINYGGNSCKCSGKMQDFVRDRRANLKVWSKAKDRNIALAFEEQS